MWWCCCWTNACGSSAAWDSDGAPNDSATRIEANVAERTDMAGPREEERILAPADSMQESRGASHARDRPSATAFHSTVEPRGQPAGGRTLRRSPDTSRLSVRRKLAPP